MNIDLFFLHFRSIIALRDTFKKYRFWQILYFSNWSPVTTSCGLAVGGVLLVVCTTHPPVMTAANLNRDTISTNVTLQTFHIQFAPDRSMSFVIQTIDMKFKSRKIVE